MVQLCEPLDAVDIEGAEAELHDGVTARFRFDRRGVSAEGLIRRVTDKYGVSDITIEEPDLESIIRRIYRDGYAAAEELAPLPAPAP